MYLKISSVKWWPFFFLCFNVLRFFHSEIVHYAGPILIHIWLVVYIVMVVEDDLVPNSNSTWNHHADLMQGSLWVWPQSGIADTTSLIHYNDVIMGAIASLITSLTIVHSTVYSDADQRKHQSSTSLVFVWGIHRDQWIPRTNGQ